MSRGSEGVFSGERMSRRRRRPVSSSSPAFQQDQAMVGQLKRQHRRRRAGAIAAAAAAAAAVVPAVLTAPKAHADIVGFDPNAWTLNSNTASNTNGVPSIDGTGSILTLTSANNGEASSAFHGTQQTVANFTAHFTYTDQTHSGNDADGIAFVIQNDPRTTTALGDGGGSLAYGGGAATRINNSIAVEFNIYGGQGGSGSQLGINGSTGNYLSTTGSGVDLANGDPVDITISYNGKILTETLVQGANTYTHSFVSSSNGLFVLLGNSLNAYVGFTGATGGLNGQQSVSNFSFVAGGATNVGGFFDSRASGNFNTNTTWNFNGTAAATAPSATDVAIVHNNNTVTVNSDAAALQLYVGGTADPFLGGAYVGNGSVNQISNTLAVGSDVIVGDGGTNLTSTGLYNIGGGSLNIGGQLHIGRNVGAVGAMTQTAGGLSVVGRAFVGEGGAGSYNLSGGTAQTGGLTVGSGAAGNGAFNLSGTATILVNGSTLLANDAGGTGTVNISGNAVLNTNGFSVGERGNGVVNFTGGTINTTTDTWLGHNNGGNGVINQSGGTLNQVHGWLNIGRNEQNNGSGLVTGTYNLSGGSINVTDGRIEVGAWSNSQGTFNVSNGATVSVNSDTTIGNGGGATGVLNMTGGDYHAGTGGGWTFVGQNGGNGTFNLSGGTLSNVGDGAANQGDFMVGVDAGTVGVFNQTGGTFNHGTNGSWFTVGRSGATGTYNLSGGVANVGSDTHIGATDNTNGAASGQVTRGVFNQTGGVYNQTGGWFNIGSNDNSGTGDTAGVYNLTGGTFNGPTAWIVVGRGASGAVGNFNMSGGDGSTSAATADWLVLGQGSGSVGNFNMSAGATLHINGPLKVAQDPGTTGTVNQTGGSVTSQWAEIGAAGPNLGTYNISGGTLTTLGEFFVGRGTGQGIFNQTGGTVNVGTWMSVGSGDNNAGNVISNGAYNLSGGTLNVGGDFNVADVGPASGTFTISGNSTLNLASNFLLAKNTNTTGTYIQSGGTVNLATGNFQIGRGDAQSNANFIMTGGTFNATNGAAMVINNASQNLQISGTANPRFSGGLLQNGGAATVTANLSLNGSSQANFSVASFNGGTTVLGGNVNLSSSSYNINHANVTIQPGWNLSASNNSSIVLNPGAGNTLGTTNAGTISLNSSALKVQSGTIDLSKYQVSATGNPTGLVTFNGLLEGYVVGAFNTNDANLGQGGRQLSPRFARIAGNDNNTPMTNADLQGGVWHNNTTIVYTGQIRVPNTNGDGTGSIAFGEDFDDSVYVAIDGAPVLSDQKWDNSTSSGMITVPAGLHNIEFRFGQGGGGAGPVTGTSTGGWTAPIGFGIQIATNGTTIFDPKSDDSNGGPGTPDGITGSTPSFYTFPSDNGTGNLFQSTAVLTGTEVDISDASTLKIGGITGNAPLNLMGAPGGTVGATFTIPDKAVPTIHSMGDVTLTNASSRATLNLGVMNSLGVGNVTVPTGSTLIVQGGGALAATGTLSVGTGALVNYAAVGSGTSTAGRVTHTVGGLTIAGTGTVDINNHELLLTSTSVTSPATIKSYLANAYDAAGNADWGKPGLTSSVAKANPTVYSVGYAYGGDQSAQDAGVTLRSGAPLGATQTVARAVLTGDANLDGTVDFFDIVQLLGYKYNTNQTASYTDGDLDYNGKVDFFDIVLLLSANYNTGKTFGPAAAGGIAAAAASSDTLSGNSGHAATASSAIAAATTVGTVGDGKPDFVYNPSTGHLTFMTDGGTFTTTGGAASFVSSLTISSASGALIGAGASSTFAGGTGATLTSTLLSSALTNSPGFTDGFDIGAVLAPGLTIDQLTADLTVKYQSLNGGSLKSSDILVPEPAGLALLGLGAAGLLARRRKNRSVAK
jgi:hypothetical protein